MTPTANVTINKSRVKIYDGKNIFLKNNQEFQFELFNPTQERIVAKIKVNGKDISDINAGIILEPGRRIYLERYLDKPTKFQFKIYDVEVNNPVVDNAIANNGDIEISFYKEMKYIPYNPTWFSDTNPYIYDTNYNKTLLTDNVGVFRSSSNCVSRNMFSSCANSDTKLEIKETGMVNEGGYSSQQLKSESMSFQNIPFHVIKYKIYPESRKEYVTTDEVELYCSNCGKKRKKESWKFCPSCGNKL